MKGLRCLALVCLLVVLTCCAAARGNIVIDTVPVGNPGNAGELSGWDAGGFGSDRICGAVGYTYNIGKYEVTTGQYTEFLNAVAATDTYGLYSTYMDHSHYPNEANCNIKRGGSSGSYTYTVGNGTPTDVASWGNRPVNFVSYWDSCRFANWMHNGQSTGPQGAGTTETGAYTLTFDSMNSNVVARNSNWQWAVTSEDEWYKAAYHKNDGMTGNYWDYPTSSDTAPGRDMADVSGNNANYYGTPYPIDSPYYTTVVGEFQNSHSPYGTFDQGGNVMEWNEARLNADRSLRGGGIESVSDGLLASQRGTYCPPRSRVCTIGFRLVEVPEPATFAFLALGGAAMLKRRRRASV